MVGGFNGYEGARDTAELLDSACSLPSLLVSEGTGRSGRSDNVVFMTGDNLILTCGGEAADGTNDLSCQSLDLPGETWLQHSVLDTDRLKAAAVVLPEFGAYVLGGFKHHTSSFLPTGSTEWVPGPVLAGDEDEVLYYGICGVALSPSKLMVVGGDTGGLFGGTRVQTYDAETDQMEDWPVLADDRWGHTCAKIGDKVVVAGGVSPMFEIVTSTTVLDLVTRESRQVGEMAGQRAFFGMANLGGIVYVFGGQNGMRSSDSWGSLEVWDELEEGWLPTDETMPTAMNEFGWVVVNANDFCP